MPYQLEWLDKPHIVYLWLTGDLTEAEFSGWVDEAIALAETVPDAKVHTLVNLEDLKRFPPLVFLARELKRLMTDSSNRDMSTVYGAGRLTRYTIELIVRVAPVRLKVFNTREDALGFIHDMVRLEQEIAATAAATEIADEATSD